MYHICVELAGKVINELHNCKGCGLGLVELLSQHFPGGT